MKQLLYILEDDQDIRELTLYALAAAGFDARGFEDGEGFWSALEGDPLPDLALLDIMLPGEDGLDILARLRRRDRYARIPVIMLTAKGSEADKVKGLNLGADDYVAKPFGVTELIARIHAVLRRSPAPAAEKLAGSELLACEDIVLDGARRTVTVGGGAVSLTYREFELLSHLLRNQGIVLSRDALMDSVWGYDYTGESRTVDVHIKSLRRKLGTAGAAIRTVRNVGYTMGE